MSTEITPKRIDKTDFSLVPNSVLWGRVWREAFLETYDFDKSPLLPSYKSAPSLASFREGRKNILELFEEQPKRFWASLIIPTKIIEFLFTLAALYVFAKKHQNKTIHNSNILLFGANIIETVFRLPKTILTLLHMPIVGVIQLGIFMTSKIFPPLPIQLSAQSSSKQNNLPFPEAEFDETESTNSAGLSKTSSSYSSISAKISLKKEETPTRLPLASTNSTTFLENYSIMNGLRGLRNLCAAFTTTKNPTDTTQSAQTGQRVFSKS
jgi:hypothetical protein